MSEELFQRLVGLAIKWLNDESSGGHGVFIPNDEDQDKVARIRTGACARQLLKVLAGVEE